MQTTTLVASSLLRRTALIVLALTTPLAAQFQSPIHSAAPTPAALSEHLQERDLADPDPNAPSIVRISLVDGDVRVLEPKEKGDTADPGWQQAITGLPLATGFTVATGDGRAEIEFEDASTAYLAPNTTVVFNTLTTVGGSPQTELSLLSGAITLNSLGIIRGTRFFIQSPTDSIETGAPNRFYGRINSYIDAMSITMLDMATLTNFNRVSAARFHHAVLNVGTLVYRKGKLQTDDLPADLTTFKPFDTWVTAHIKSRNQQMLAEMKQAHLDKPLPGLTDFAGEGHFFDCAPYGTCWEPTNGFDGNGPSTDADDTSAANTSGPHLTLAAYHPQAAAPQLPGSVNKKDTWFEDDAFPCSPFGIRSWYQRDPITGKVRLVRTETNTSTGLWLTGRPWHWGVCHTGAWIHYHRHYVWVSQRRFHHHPPVHWVKCDKKTGFVPVHPHDRARLTSREAPGNLRHGVFSVDPKDPHSVVLTEFPTDHLKLVAEPREFAQLHAEHLNLQHVGAPAPVAHSIRVTLNAPHGTDGHAPDGHAPDTHGIVALAFNPSHHGFELAQSGTGHFTNSLHTLQTHSTSGVGAFSAHEGTGWSGPVSTGFSSPGNFSTGSTSSSVGSSSSGGGGGFSGPSASSVTSGGSSSGGPHH